jgi:hypothetical protein
MSERLGSMITRILSDAIPLLIDAGQCRFKVPIATSNTVALLEPTRLGTFLKDPRTLIPRIL